MRFMRFKHIYFAVSGFLVLASVLLIVFLGLRPSIDFVGGSQLEVAVADETELETNAVREVLKDIYAVSSVQNSGEDRFLIKGAAIDNTVKDLALQELRIAYTDVTELRFETIGPSLSRELLQKTLMAVLIVSVFIAGYIAKQFRRLTFGIAALSALFHDVLIVTGAFVLFGWLFGVEIDVLFVTALLTTLAFSVHDTIVVFDRIRELRQRHAGASWSEIADAAITETLNRSFNNSVTTVFMLLALTLLGGESIRWFALALLLGVIVGTYSSPFVAVPLLVQLLSRKKRSGS